MNDAFKNLWSNSIAAHCRQPSNTIQFSFQIDSYQQGFRSTGEQARVNGLPEDQGTEAMPPPPASSKGSKGPGQQEGKDGGTRTLNIVVVGTEGQYIS